MIVVVTIFREAVVVDGPFTGVTHAQCWLWSKGYDIEPLDRDGASYQKVFNQGEIISHIREIREPK